MDEEENAASSASYTTNDHRAEAELKEITYNGRTYRQRPDLETYLLMGVDTSGAGLGVNSYAGGGQADVQMVVVLDNINRTWQMLQLNRTASCRCRCGGPGRHHSLRGRTARPGLLLRRRPGTEL